MLLISPKTFHSFYCFPFAIAASQFNAHLTAARFSVCFGLSSLALSRRSTGPCKIGKPFPSRFPNSFSFFPIPSPCFLCPTSVYTFASQLFLQPHCLARNCFFASLNFHATFLDPCSRVSSHNRKVNS